MKNINDYKKGDIVCVVEGVIYYYVEEDKCYKHGGKPCYFLATDIDNRNTHIRVNPNVENWELVCREHYENLKMQG